MASEKQLQIQINDLELRRINLQAGEQDVGSAFRQTQLSVDSTIRQAENVVENSENNIRNVRNGLLNAENNVKTVQNALRNAENNLVNAKKIKDVSLRQLSNQINAARLRVTDTQVQYGKLSVESPIS